MTSPLPSNMALCTIRGQYGSTETVIGTGQPQFNPFIGMRVTFTPAYPFVTDMSATPNPLVVALKPRTFTTDSQGYLSDPAYGNTRDCQVVGSDDPDINPSGWKYLVTFAGPGSQFFSAFRTPAPAGATIDMAIITPQRIAPANAPSAAEIAAADAAASAAAAQAAVASIRRGQAGGVAPLDSDGDVNNAAGTKVLPGGGGGTGITTFAALTDVSTAAKALNAATTSGHPTTLAEMRSAIGAGTGSSNLVIGTTAGTAADAAATATALAAAALDSAVVHDNGDETIDGHKTFTTSPSIPPSFMDDNPVTRAELNAATAGLSGGTSNLVIGTTAGTAADGALVATLLARIVALETAMGTQPWIVTAAGGVFPPRPATTRSVWFIDAIAPLTLDGAVTGGGGMVPGKDLNIKAFTG